MRNLKKSIAAFTMMTAMLVGTTFANGGIIIARDADQKVETTKPGPCGETPSTDYTGIIIAFTGIIIARTGIIIARDASTKDEGGVVNCGIIIA